MARITKKGYLDLTETEQELIFALLSHVRLGSDNIYSDAAFNLLELYEDNSTMIDDLYVSIGFTVETDRSETRYTEDDQYSLTIEVDEK